MPATSPLPRRPSIRLATIGSQFRPIAARSFAAAAVKEARSNPTQALAYAQKAVALDSGPNSRFALGVAQLANNDSAAALVSLKAAHDAGDVGSEDPASIRR